MGAVLLAVSNELLETQLLDKVLDTVRGSDVLLEAVLDRRRALGDGGQAGVECVDEVGGGSGKVSAMPASYAFMTGSHLDHEAK